MHWPVRQCMTSSQRVTSLAQEHDRKHVSKIQSRDTWKYQTFITGGHTGLSDAVTLKQCWCRVPRHCRRRFLRSGTVGWWRDTCPDTTWYQGAMASAVCTYLPTFVYIFACLCHEANCCKQCAACAGMGSVTYTVVPVQDPYYPVCFCQHKEGCSWWVT